MSSPQVIRFKPTGPENGLEQRGVPSVAIEGTQPDTSGARFWTGPDGKTRAGIWTSTPGKIGGSVQGTNEFCVIVEGKIGLIDRDTGEEEIFEKGECFLVPKGANIIWNIYQDTIKYMMVAEPDA
jgi:uncharacterized protein